MDLRRAFFSRGMKVLSHPTVTKLLADPRAMDLFVAAVRIKERASDVVEHARRRAADLVGLATSQELRDLRIVVRDLERKLRRHEE